MTNTATAAHARLLTNMDIRTLRGPRHFDAGTVHQIVAMDAHGLLLRMSGTTAEAHVTYDEAEPVVVDEATGAWVSE